MKRGRRGGEVCGVRVPLRVVLEERSKWEVVKAVNEKGGMKERVDLLGLQVDAPALAQREEESLRDDLRKGIWNRLLPLLFDGHARGEGTNFERIRARNLVCSREGHGLEHKVFEGLGDAV